MVNDNQHDNPYDNPYDKDSSNTSSNAVSHDSGSTGGTAPQPPTADDWLLPRGPQEQYAEEQPRPGRDRLRRLVGPVGLVVAGLIAGGGVVAAAHAVGDDGSTAGAQPAWGPAGSDPRGGLGGDPQDGDGAGFDRSGDPGGLSGEEHLTGTLSAVGDSTVTVRSSDGTATYQVTDSTQVVRDGAEAALSDLQVGDPVLVHVYPASSGGDRLVVERIFAGTLPDLPGQPPGDDGDGDGVPGSGGSAASSSNT